MFFQNYAMTSSKLVRFDREIFCVTLQRVFSSTKRRGKTSRKIHCVSYFGWVLKIIKFQQEDTFKNCNYLEEMLNYIRVRVPSEDLYQVLLKDFCQAFQIKDTLKAFGDLKKSKKNV